MRKELKIGILLFGISMTLQCCLGGLPDFLFGLLMGVAICFEILGALPENVYEKWKAKKKALLHFS